MNREELTPGKTYRVIGTDHSVLMEFRGKFMYWQKPEDEPSDELDVERWRATFDTGWAEGWRWYVEEIDELSPMIGVK